MKRIALAASTAAALALMAAPAFAGDTALSGTVASICSVTAPASATVALSGSSTLAPLSIQCNAVGGFDLTVTSAGEGKLTSGVATNRDFYGYKLAVTGLFGATSLATPKNAPSPSVIANRVNFVSAAADFGLSVSDVTLNGRGYAGTYSDTVTFAITAN